METNNLSLETQQALDLIDLECHLTNDSKAPSLVCVDGKWHDYEVIISGSSKKGRYMGCYYPENDDAQKYFLVFNYGLNDDPQQKTYSSLKKD